MDDLDNYTTQEKRDADSLKDAKDQTEQSKTIISNDAYAISQYMSELSKSIIKSLARFKR